MLVASSESVVNMSHELQLYTDQKNSRDQWISNDSGEFIFAGDALVFNEGRLTDKLVQIEKMKADKYTWLSEYKNNEFEFVSRAAHSENSAITYQETFEILRGRTDGISPNKIAVVRGIVKARSQVIAAVIEDNSVDINLLRSLNRDIEEGMSYEAGLIRGERPDKTGLGTFVNLGKNISFVPPEPGLQGSLLVDRFDKIMSAKRDNFFEISALVAELTYSQMFYNGNKRTAREFTNALLLQKGYPSIAIGNEEKYLSAITDMDKTGDATNLMIHFCDNILDRQNELSKNEQSNGDCV